MRADDNYMTIFLAGMLFSLLLNACTPDLENEIGVIRKQVVVDGWIEQNGFAYVILTYNTEYFGNLDSASFRGLVATRAKVTVSDGHDSEILTLMRDTNYFPPFVYRSNSLKGKAGYAYTLLIVDNRDTISAVTTIQQPVTIDSMWFEANSKGDTAGLIKGIISDDAGVKNYYKTFYRIKNKNKIFVPTFISDYDDFYFNGQKFIFSLRKGPETYLKPFEDIYFNIKDTILIKISSIDKESYDFWAGYQNEVMNSGNPFAANHYKIESNVKGGLGVWCGYGSKYYSIIPK